MRIGNNIEVLNIDLDNEVGFEIEYGDNPNSYVWIDKDDAIKLIAHLQEQFGI